MSEIENSGAKGRCLFMFLGGLTLFILLLVYVYKLNFNLTF
ncbi:MAG: hypothetical protein AAF598_18725 [Bacteroidota bacterium]